MDNKTYKMETTLCRRCLEKMEPLLLKVAETSAKEGQGKCSIIFQVHESGITKALFLPFKEAKMASDLFRPLWVKAEEVKKGVDG